MLTNPICKKRLYMMAKCDLAHQCNVGLTYENQKESYNIKREKTKPT